MPEITPIPGRSGYFASRDGRIFSRWRRGRHYQNGPIYPLVELKRPLSGNGYLQVGISAENEYVHVLILETFVGSRPSERHEACHENGIKTDCRAENLRWDLPEGNHSDRVKHGTSNRGERNGCARLTRVDVETIRRRLMDGESVAALARETGRGWATIADIEKGRTWGWL